MIVFSTKVLWVNHPFIVGIFEEHCAQGNTPRTFIPKLYGGIQGFMYLCRTNHNFKAVNDKYKSKEPVSKFHGRRSNQTIPTT